MNMPSKNRFEAREMFLVSPVVYIACMLLLMKCDTGYCKMQQANSVEDPFSQIERENPELFMPTMGADRKTQAPVTAVQSKSPNRSGYIDLNLNASELTSPQSHSGQPSFLENNKQIREFYYQLASRKRPVFPERSRPGGLISSCVSDPLMSSELESLLESRLNGFDDGTWNELTLTELTAYLQKILPTYLNVTALEEEGIEADVTKVPKLIAVGPLRTRLQDVLKPLQLAYILRHGRLEITTESNVCDGEGVLRIYDVTTLVANVQNGIDQLNSTITATIDPDYWIVNGGSSAIQFHVVPGESEAVTTAIICCPSTVHVRVQDLLDRLNSVSSSGPRLPVRNHANSSSASTTRSIDAGLRIDERPKLYSGF